MTTDHVDEAEFELGLRELGDEGSSFRTRNDPSRPFQRHTITERNGNTTVRCTARDVVHGYMKDGEGPASLLVYDFQLDVRKRGRRIKSVDMEFYYYSTDSAAQPEVVSMTPEGRVTLAPTSRTETSTRGGEVNLGGNVLGAQLGAGWKQEKTVTEEIHDAVTIIGSMRTIYRNYGGPNTATWTVLENESTEKGVPSHITTAILLRRNDDEAPFQCTFKIWASVDMASRISRLFASIPGDDPILYDPYLPPTTKGHQYDADNLADVDLKKIGVAAVADEMPHV